MTVAPTRAPTRLAFLLTLPVAYHCIFQLGFQSGNDRILAHSPLGCAPYGAFTAKVLVVRLHRFRFGCSRRRAACSSRS